MILDHSNTIMFVLRVTLYIKVSIHLEAFLYIGVTLYTVIPTYMYKSRHIHIYIGVPLNLGFLTYRGSPIYKVSLYIGIPLIYIYIHFEHTIVDLDSFWIYICRISLLLDLHLSNLTACHATN